MDPVLPCHTGVVHDERSDPDDDLFEELERRALMGMPADDADDGVDVIDALREADLPPVTAEDATLGGYIRKHGRVPAFAGVDDEPYTVDVDAEAQADGSWVSFLVFIRWAATGAGIMDHVESGDIGRGATQDEARRCALELSLFEVRTELDAAIERKRRETG